MVVEYPNLSSLSNTSGIEGILTLPNASHPFFWTLILGSIWFVLTLSMYFREKGLTGRGNILSSASISSLACIMLALVGSLLGIFTVATFLPILVFGIIIIAIWVIVG